jgi:hypothetical protein
MSKQVDPRPAWATEFLAAREQMRMWIDAALARHAQTPYRGGHDEGSFIQSWWGYHQLFGDARVIEFGHMLRDGFAEWARENMTHGFYPVGEAHHQTEIFTCFLCQLWLTEPDDLTAELIVDAAHHIGNWVEGPPAWYDHDQRRFLSWRIGTEAIGSGDKAGYEVPDHFRLLQIALVAHRITDDERYLQLSREYAGRWVEEILNAPLDRPPLIIRSGGSDISEAEARKAAGAHHRTDSTLDLVEPHVPAGTVDVLLDLHAITGEEYFARAAGRLCEAMSPALSDPYSNPPAALLQRYRTATGDTSLDERALAAITGMGPRTSEGAPVLVVETSGAVAGIGKRMDMVRWAYRDEAGTLSPEVSLSPSSLTLGWQLTGDEAYAEAALGLVAGRLALARASLRDGRDHGCAGTSIGAVASGHGRDGGYGNVTGALLPLACGATRSLAQEQPAVRFRGAADNPGLPPEIASLVRVQPGGEIEVRLHNAADLAQTVGVVIGETPWQQLQLAAGETAIINS